MSDDKSVYVTEFGDHGLSEPQRIERLEGQVDQVECDPLGRFVPPGTRMVADSNLVAMDDHSQLSIQGPSDERPRPPVVPTTDHSSKFW